MTKTARALPVVAAVGLAAAFLIACNERSSETLQSRPREAPGETEVVAPPADSGTGSAEATDVLRRYYAAIEARDFRRAYELWESSGSASGQTFEEFAGGFGETASVEVEIGAPGPVEGAAGSRYVEVPVVVRAVTAGGEQQRFEGTYTLRRSVVDGATAEERRWHIYSASLDPVR